MDKIDQQTTTSNTITTNIDSPNIPFTTHSISNNDNNNLNIDSNFGSNDNVNSNTNPNNNNTNTTSDSPIIVCDPFSSTPPDLDEDNNNNNNNNMDKGNSIILNNQVNKEDVRINDSITTNDNQQQQNSEGFKFELSDVQDIITENVQTNDTNENNRNNNNITDNKNNNNNVSADTRLGDDTSLHLQRIPTDFALVANEIINNHNNVGSLINENQITGQKNKHCGTMDLNKIRNRNNSNTIPDGDQIIITNNEAGAEEEGYRTDNEDEDELDNCNQENNSNDDYEIIEYDNIEGFNIINNNRNSNCAHENDSVNTGNSSDNNNCKISAVNRCTLDGGTSRSSIITDTAENEAKVIIERKEMIEIDIEDPTTHHNTNTADDQMNDDNNSSVVISRILGHRLDLNTGELVYRVQSITLNEENNSIKNINDLWLTKKEILNIKGGLESLAQYEKMLEKKKPKPELSKNRENIIIATIETGQKAKPINKAKTIEMELKYDTNINQTSAKERISNKKLKKSKKNKKQLEEDKDLCDIPEQKETIRPLVKITHPVINSNVENKSITTSAKSNNKRKREIPNQLNETNEMEYEQGNTADNYDDQQSNIIIPPQASNTGGTPIQPKPSITPKQHSPKSSPPQLHISATSASSTNKYFRTPAPDSIPNITPQPKVSNVTNQKKSPQVYHQTIPSISTPDSQLMKTKPRITINPVTGNVATTPYKSYIRLKPTSIRDTLNKIQPDKPIKPLEKKFPEFPPPYIPLEYASLHLNDELQFEWIDTRIAQFYMEKQPVVFNWLIDQELINR